VHMRHVLEMSGCRPLPLAGYLKALGVLRLVSAQADETAAGAWQDDRFVLHSRLDRPGLSQFFLEHYQPSPVIAPWNGGSGFYVNRPTPSAAVNAIRQSQSPRFAAYRQTIASVDAILDRLQLNTKPADEAKDALIATCRNELPDDAVEWLDAVLVLTPKGTSFPPLLGSGGSDGNLEFTNNFMQRLADVFDLHTGKPRDQAAHWLEAALFDQPVQGLVEAAIGQFAPGSAGGPNASAGYEGRSRVNPWDFILMLEGALTFSAAATKRLASGRSAGMSFPFTVQVSSAGNGGWADKDAESARAEMWLPLWTRPARYAELAALFQEGRAQVNGRAARNSLDFARACSKLGVDRGIHSFQRYAFLKNNRFADMALPEPLTRFHVRRRVEADLIDDLAADGWLDRLASCARKSGQALQSAHRQVSDAVFALCQHGGAWRTQMLLRTLGQIERLLADRPGVRAELPPLTLRSERWLELAWDGSAEFALAASVAAWSWPYGPAVRAYFSPVDPLRPQRWLDEVTPRVVWSEADLSRNLCRLLQRRQLDANHPDWRSHCLDGKPWRGPLRVRWADVMAFVQGELSDARLEELLWGLLPLSATGTLARWRPPLAPGAPPAWLPWAVAVVKLVCTSDADVQRLLAHASDVQLPVPPGLFQTLYSDDPQRLPRAVDLAERRLYASGLTPRLRGVATVGLAPRRILAAVAFPLSQADLSTLLRRVTEPEDAETTASPETHPQEV
ncbi:MAG: type I-U CRISPR-associated protein Csx17, partial [Alicyclobacillus sp.]|nr:type I-U CRISPR-associated protein Csx17 [Alicyclobacillus sp.]